MSRNEAIKTLKGYAECMKRGEFLSEDEVQNANKIMDDFQVTSEEVMWIFKVA